MVRIEAGKMSGLAKVSAADTFQVRSVAQERFVRLLGKLTDTHMQEVGKALAIVLAIR